MARTGGRGDEGKSSFAHGLGRMSGAAMAFRDAWRTARSPMTPEQQMAIAYQRAQQQHEIAVARHESRIRRAKRRAKSSGTAAIVAGGAAIADLVIAGPAEVFFLAGPAAVLLGWRSFKNVRKSETLEPPAPPQMPLPPTRPLEAGDVGASESQRLNRARIQLNNLLPTIATTHAAAAAEIRDTDREVAPPLNQLVERLTVLNQVIRDNPGSVAAAAAERSATQISRSVSSGGQMYEDLIEAGVELLGAPGAIEPAIHRLHQSIDELTSYSAGLARAAETYPSL